MNLAARIWNGPYPKTVFLTVVSLGAALITAVAVGLEGYLIYQGHETIPGATHISETFFTGFLATFITGLVLHRHASRGGQCATLEARGRCPFAGIFGLGLGLGALGTLGVYFIQGSDAVSFDSMMQAKILQGLATGLVIPLLFDRLGLLRHPKVVA